MTNPTGEALTNTTERYKVVEGSQSCHCCFEWTVVDTTKPTMIGGEQFENQFDALCECWDEEAAQLICKSLNAVKPAS